MTESRQPGEDALTAARIFNHGRTQDGDCPHRCDCSVLALAFEDFARGAWYQPTCGGDLRQGCLQISSECTAHRVHRLETERDTAEMGYSERADALRAAEARAEEVEARVRVLEAALREATDMLEPRARNRLRTVLSGKEQP